MQGGQRFQGLFGFVFSIIFSLLFLAALYFAVRVKKQTQIPCRKRIRLMLAGVRGGKRLEPYSL